MKRLIIIALLFSFALNAKGALQEASSREITIELHSFTFNAFTAENSQLLEIWFRFQIDPFSTENIETFDVWMNCNDQEMLMQELPLPVPNPFGYIYKRLIIPSCIVPSFSIEDYILSNRFNYRIVFLDPWTKEDTTMGGSISTENARLDTFQKQGDYAIKVKTCIYDKLEHASNYYSSFPELKDYVNQHPGGDFFDLFFTGEAFKNSAYCVLGVEFSSENENCFLLRRGLNEATSTHFDYADMLENGKKEAEY